MNTLLLVGGVGALGYWYITHRGTVPVPSGLPTGPIGPQPISGPTGPQPPGSPISTGEQVATGIATAGGAIAGGPVGGFIAGGIASGVGAINRALFPNSTYGGGLNRAKDIQAIYTSAQAAGARVSITNADGGEVSSDDYFSGNVIITRDWRSSPGMKAGNDPSPTRDHRRTA